MSSRLNSQATKKYNEIKWFDRKSIK